MLIVRATLAVAALCFCSAVLSEPPSPTPAKVSQDQKAQPNESAKDAKTAQDKSKNSPFPVTLDGPVTIEKSQQDRDADAREREHKASNDRKLIVWTAVLAVTTLILAGITAFLARYTYKLWLDASNTSKRQAGEMQQSLATAADAAWAAKKTVKEMRRNATHQLRAYVCVKGATINLKPVQAPTAQVQIHNFGATPAYNVRCWIHMWIAPHPLAIELPLPEKEFGATDSVLAPGNYLTLVLQKKPPVPSENMALLGTTEGTIYIYGRVEYRDAFGENRWANYRLIYGGPEPMMGENLKPDSAGNNTSES